MPRCSARSPHRKPASTCPVSSRWFTSARQLITVYHACARKSFCTCKQRHIRRTSHIQRPSHQGPEMRLNPPKKQSDETRSQIPEENSHEDPRVRARRFVGPVGCRCARERRGVRRQEVLAGAGQPLLTETASFNLSTNRSR